MRLSLLLLTVPVLLPPAAGAQCDFYDDQATFLALLDARRQTLNFDAGPIGPIEGEEFAASGLTFDSPLAPPDGQLEVAPADFFWESPYLSIDNRPFSGGSDLSDSLEIYVEGTWPAIGFDIVDGSILPPAEDVEVFDALGRRICQAPLGDNLSYIGIISPEPIGAVVVTEGNGDGDDIGYDDFVLGAGRAIFADGFEAGNADRWFETIPE